MNTIDNANLVTRAVIFAAKAHNGQLRKGTDKPYIVHPMAVAAIAAGLTSKPEVIAAAVLHDTMEDAKIARKELEAQFGPRVAYLVANESENKREGQKEEDTWQVRKQETIDHLKQCRDRDVKIVALADKLANLRDIYRDHLALGEAFWERFNQKDPELIGWYYRSFAETCAELADTTAYAEYVELLARVWRV